MSRKTLITPLQAFVKPTPVPRIPSRVTYCFANQIRGCNQCTGTPCATLFGNIHLHFRVRVRVSYNIHGDTISIYPYDILVQTTFRTPEVWLIQHSPDSITRGNKYKLSNHRFHYDLRKHCFSARIVNIWNSLPNHVVDVNTINIFKTRLDRFWANQDVKYDFTADLT